METTSSSKLAEFRQLRSNLESPKSLQWAIWNDAIVRQNGVCRPLGSGSSADAAWAARELREMRQIYGD